MKNKFCKYILPLAAAFALCGCGLDLGQIYIQIKDGNLQKMIEEEQRKIALQKNSAYSAAMTAAPQQTMPELPLDAEARTVISFVKQTYGEKAAKEAEDAYMQGNKKLMDAAKSSRNQKDFEAKQKQIMTETEVRVHEITSKFSREKK